MRLTVIVGLLALVAPLAACQRKAEAPKAPPRPAPVVVAVAVEGSSPITVQTVGAVEPIASVMLRPQISGQVVQIPAGEGVDVAAEAVVVQLDSRPYEAALKQAQAELARDRVMAADAHLAAEQYNSAMLAKAMPKRTSEEALAKASAADATVAADEAAEQTAKLNLEFCRIIAPFAGRLGSLKVKTGTVVKANETDLIELVQLQPIDVGFSVPEDRLPLIRAAAKASPLRARVQVPGDPGQPVEGNITFVDNRVDPATGTLRLKARFDNADRRLWPGQFVTVTLTLGQDERVVLVPSDAVQNSQEGATVFVVKADQSVELRKVTTGRAGAGKTVIQSGLTAGETVVTDGQLRLGPGMKVEARPPVRAAGN